MEQPIKEHLSSMTGKARQLYEMAGNAKLSGPINPLTYPKSSRPFSNELFKNPTSEYRGCPLWAWNNKLEKDQLLRQIDIFADMGMGGFHMHVRTGLDTEYMGVEFMNIIHSCVAYARSKNMLACLYDDDRWPSGSAGGRVTKMNPEYRGSHVLFTPHKYGSVDLGDNPSPASARASRSENGTLLARFQIELDDMGCLKSSRMLNDSETGTNLWYAYAETNLASPWFNDETYIDSLSSEAIAKFIETTHVVYKQKIGDNFGSSVPCIFTDEPQFATKTQLSNPRAKDDIFFPWSSDIPKTFQQEYREDLIASLPQLVWNLPDGQPSAVRYQYHDHVCERFVTAFMDQLAGWCQRNNLFLDGHMMEEPTLRSQTTAIGEAMRCYRRMQMPGMDLLVDGVEYNTAKQASSVSRQNGHRGTMSEIYGVTHWYFTFEGHKGCGDWQAALGITFRVHHLTWVSMTGEGKRDYPASIGYQSPWYKEYPYIEDHFARVNVTMTRGRAVTRVGVFHPIESFWLCFGPNESGDEMEYRDKAFEDLSNWLLHGLIDFDFISEKLLPDQIGDITNKLHVGHCAYDVIVLPNLRTVRSSTLIILRKFAYMGGKIIIAGSAPDLVDAKVPSSSITFENARHIYWSRQSILTALEPFRELRINTEGSEPTDKLLYQMRDDDDERFVFICNTDRSSLISTVVQIRGSWKVRKLDTFNGTETNIRSHASLEWTTFPYIFQGCGSLLIHLLPILGSSAKVLPQRVPMHDLQPCSKVLLDDIKLSEPNILVLDYAQFALNNGPYSEVTEVLQIDNVIRDRLQIPKKGSAWKQPYAIPAHDRTPRANVTIRFQFRSHFDIPKSTMLAVEAVAKSKIHLNNVAIETSQRAQPNSWWVDESIETITVPRNLIRKGNNELILEFPFGILTNIERIYLLGEFAVFFSEGSRSPTLYPLQLNYLTWGDITMQGLPFYVGNIIYNCSVSVPEEDDTSTSKLILSVPEFSSPVLTIHDSKNSKIGRIAFQPRTIDLKKQKAGRHQFSIKAFGNRYNSFGHFHLQDQKTEGCSPDIWRSAGDWWTDDYKVKPVGVLKCPNVYLQKSDDYIEDYIDPEDWVLIERERQ